MMHKVHVFSESEKSKGSVLAMYPRIVNIFGNDLSENKRYRSFESTLGRDRECECAKNIQEDTYVLLLGQHLHRTTKQEHRKALVRH